MTAVLIIAGVDSSGGAGLLRDIRALTELGAEALCAVTAVTAQTNAEVVSVHYVPPSVIGTQVSAALAARRVSAVKIGMLGTAAIVEAVADSLLTRHSGVPIVLDPVLLATSGGVLLDAEGREAMRGRLFPMATVITPNLPEAAALLGCEPAVDEPAAIDQAQQLLSYGPDAVLIKGGHGTGTQAVDYLVTRSDPIRPLPLPRVDAIQRGTGCALASAIASGLAAGATLEKACTEAKEYVHRLISRTGTPAAAKASRGRSGTGSSTL
jgi:hydroxymethylpyrimidine/phosphomethylpyrimidine kinase